MASMQKVLSRFVGQQAKSFKVGPLMGWITQKSTDKAHREMGRKMVRMSEVKPEATIVEFGAGRGMVLEELFRRKNPAHVYAVAVSDDYGKQLEQQFDAEINGKDGQESRLTLHSDNAINMPFINDSSVDYFYGTNAICFLDPLPDYLAEIHRILKPGGNMLWGVMGQAVESDGLFLEDIDWNKYITAMEDAKFHYVTVDETDKRNFPHPIFIKAKKPL